MFRFCINKTLTTSGVATASPLNNLVAHHLRGPLPACWLLQLRRRDFRAQPNKKSIGLGSTLGPERGDSYDSKMNEFYQDNKMQKLWNNTFERISTFQNVRHNQQPQGVPTSSTADSATETGDRLKGGPTSASSSMFSLDDQQMMKLSFAEGYFYGQENKKKPRFRLLYIIRETIIFGIIIAIIYSVTNGENPFKRAMSGRSFEIQPEDIDVTFSDVKGCDEAKQELADIVEFLKRPSKFSRLGGKLPKGVLLVGPPGTGKTLLARAVAGEAGVPFFHASGSEFDEILVGQGARRVRDLFDRAKQRTPCVIFIDEIDSIGGKRSSSMFHPYANQTVNQLLSEMDGFAQNEGVIVMGATNRASDLDKALVRPGRFDVQVTVPTPDYKGRKELFEHYLGKVRQARNIDIEMLCRTTIGFTGADIENLINQAALKAATENLDIVSQESLEYARDKILMGPERRNRLPDEEQNMMTAYHEAGHALAAHYTEKANPVHKITIVSRGSSLGHTSFLPERDHYSQTKEQLSAFIDVSLGGRVAEELIYGSDRVTSGCSDDLRRANDLATKMVRDFGMSDKIGMRVVRDDESQMSSQVVISNFSDATSELVDSEISKLLADSRKRVENLLTEHRNELVMLAEALVKYETLDSAEMKLVLEGKDPRVLRQERERERRNKLNNLKPPERLPLDLLK